MIKIVICQTLLDNKVNFDILCYVNMHICIFYFCTLIIKTNKIPSARF